MAASTCGVRSSARSASRRPSTSAGSTRPSCPSSSRSTTCPASSAWTMPCGRRPGVRRRRGHRPRAGARRAGPGVTRMRRGCARRSAVSGALMLVAAAGLASAQEARPRERLLVVPFENAGRDGRLFWVSEGAATLLTGTLDAMGVGAVSRDERLTAFERLQLPSAASLSEATIIRTAQILGATDVVMGSFSVADGQISVTARALRLDTGRMRPPLVETGPLTEFFAVFERLARQLAPSAAPPPAAAAVERGSLTVFENYIKGLVAETADAQIRFLEAALKLRAGLRPGADRPLAGLHGSGRSREGGGGGARGAVGLAGIPAGALPRGAVPHPPAAVRRGVCAAEGPLGRLSQRDRAEQPRRHPGPPRRHAADGPRGLLLHEGGGSRPGRSRLRLQRGLRLLAGPGSARRPSTG